MEIKLLITRITEENYALEMGIYDAQGVLQSAGRGGDDLPGTLRLQEGYRTPQQAAHALWESLTFAPPDLAIYDEGIARVSELVDDVTNLNDAMIQVGQRLTSAEDTVAALITSGTPRGQKINPLLAPRQETDSGRPASNPPSLRSRVSVGMESRAGAISGGPIRGRGSE